MGDSASESESSWCEADYTMMPPSNYDDRSSAPFSATFEQMQKRLDSVQQENKVLRCELDAFKLRVKALHEEIKNLRQASVTIQARAEQEEEFISNTLLKKINSLKKEKETLAHHYEQEEECLTNDLSRKLHQLRQEKCRLEQTLEQEQECLVNKLMRKIEKMEADTARQKQALEQVRREKVELENTLEQEQEAIVNYLWKRMEKLEEEKRSLQSKLNEPTDPANANNSNIEKLRNSVEELRAQLEHTQRESSEKIQRYRKEEKAIREENVRLHRKLQLEIERREALCRHLSESESSLEMEEERQYNEIAMSGGSVRAHSVASPVPPNLSPNSSRPLSPVASGRCYACNQPVPAGGSINVPLTSAAFVSHPACTSTAVPVLPRRPADRFIKPVIPLSAVPSTLSVAHGSQPSEVSESETYIVSETELISPHRSLSDTSVDNSIFVHRSRTSALESTVAEECLYSTLDSSDSTNN